MAARLAGTFSRDLLKFPRTGWWTYLPLCRTLAKTTTGKGESKKSVQKKAKAEVFQAEDPPQDVLKTTSPEEIDDNTKYQTWEYYGHGPLSFADMVVDTLRYRQEQPSPSQPYHHTAPWEK